ncbi:MAG: hypothetical protein HGA85_04725 [Nanoarchaeota archaeon]|nr:hypothetical protein [Nanoarchaeota archaeon]
MQHHNNIKVQPTRHRTPSPGRSGAEVWEAEAFKWTEIEKGVFYGNIYDLKQQMYPKKHPTPQLNQIEAAVLIGLRERGIRVPQVYLCENPDEGLITEKCEGVPLYDYFKTGKDLTIPLWDASLVAKSSKRNHTSL